MHDTTQTVTSSGTFSSAGENDAKCDKMSHLEAEKEYLRLKELLASMKRGKHSRQRGTKGAFGSLGCYRKAKTANLLRPNKQ